MAYKVNPDGSVETDTAEEAMKLARLMSSGSEKVAPPSTPQRAERKGKSRKGKKLGPRRPELAKDYGVKVGQVYECPSDGRVIQIVRLLKDGIKPKTLKNSKGRSNSQDRNISYDMVHKRYKLKKDVK